MVFLETRQLKKFGGIIAVKEISLCIDKGEILGMIGPNGSGKSTFVNLLSGIYRPDKGNITFIGEDITGLPVHRITGKGLPGHFKTCGYFRIFPS